MPEINLPAQPGTYLLWLRLFCSAEIQVGRLGLRQLLSGWYAYAGSAFGPGGLKGRVGHHLGPVTKCHWHVDYLRQAAPVGWIWYLPDVDREHEWSTLLAGMPGANQPVKGFGSSDCQCFSHLTWFPRRPGLKKVQKHFMAAFPQDRNLKSFRPEFDPAAGNKRGLSSERAK